MQLSMCVKVSKHFQKYAKYRNITRIVVTNYLKSVQKCIVSLENHANSTKA